MGEAPQAHTTPSGGWETLEIDQNPEGRSSRRAGGDSQAQTEAAVHTQNFFFLKESSAWLLRLFNRLNQAPLDYPG